MQYIRCCIWGSNCVFCGYLCWNHMNPAASRNNPSPGSGQRGYRLDLVWCSPLMTPLSTWWWCLCPACLPWYENQSPLQWEEIEWFRICRKNNHGSEEIVGLITPMAGTYQMDRKSFLGHPGHALLWQGWSSRCLGLAFCSSALQEWPYMLL